MVREGGPPERRDLLALTGPDHWSGEDPLALLETLRAAGGPVYTEVRHGAGFWSVVGFDQAHEILRQPAVLSSAKGALLTTDERGDAGGGRMLAISDPPEHTNLRSKVAALFSRDAIERQRPKIRRYAAELVAGTVTGRVVDFVSAVASPLPIRVSYDIVGIPRGDHNLFAGHVARTAEAKGEEDQRIAYGEALVYLLDLVAEKRKGDGDLIECLLSESMGPEDIALNALNFAFAGTETVRLASAGGVYELLHDERAQASVRASGITSNFIEEVVRFTTPPTHVARTVRRSTTMSSVTLDPGDKVVVWLPAVNRDPDVFDRPHEFLPNRLIRRHLGYGAGPHFCIGAGLARIELHAIFDALLSQTKDFELIEPPNRLASSVVWGVASLRLRLDAA